MELILLWCCFFLRSVLFLPYSVECVSNSRILFIWLFFLASSVVVVVVGYCFSNWLLLLFCFLLINSHRSDCNKYHRFERHTATTQITACCARGEMARYASQSQQRTSQPCHKCTVVKRNVRSTAGVERGKMMSEINMCGGWIIIDTYG